MTRISRRRTVVAGCLALVSAAARPARAAAPVMLRVSMSDPADESASHYVWYRRFADHLKDALGDRIQPQLFANGQLGKEADVVEQVKIGSTDMMITGSSIWATVLPELGMLDLGYMFDNYAHAARAMDGPAGLALTQMLRDRTGVSVVGWGFHFGARSVYTKMPARKLADLAGVKLRVLPAPAFIETFKIMGAIPTPIPINELYTALQTGVVDGFEHDPGTTLAMKVYEVVKYCLLTEHLFSPMGAFVSKRALDRIPADALPAFRKAATDATADERMVSGQKTEESIAKLKEFGIAFSPLPAGERRSIQDRMAAQLYAPFAEKYPATRPIFSAIAAARG